MTAYTRYAKGNYFLVLTDIAWLNKVLAYGKLGIGYMELWVWSL